MGEIGLVGLTNIFNPGVADGCPAGNADMYYKARRLFLADMMSVKLTIFIS